MNTAQTSKIYYAIDIDCGTDETNSNVYLNSGHFRFITDDVDPVALSATYEDLSPVKEYWEPNVLAFDKIDSTNIDIDIVTNCNYATLAGFSFSIVNNCVDGTPWHKSITELDRTWIIGSSIKLYVVIDDVFYTRWSGIVSDYAISSEYVKINCDDIFVKELYPFPKYTIGNVNFPNASPDLIGKTLPCSVGNVKYSKLYCVEDVENVVTTKLNSMFPLARLKPYMSTGADAANAVLGQCEINFDVDEFDQHLCFSNSTNYDNGNTTPHTIYAIVDNTKCAVAVAYPKYENYDSLVGKSVSLSKSSTIDTDEDRTYYTILDIIPASIPGIVNDNCQMIYIIIDSIPQEVIDYGNFYGNITTEPLTDIGTVTDETLYVFIWDQYRRFVVSDSANVDYYKRDLTNAKAIHEDGPLTLYKNINDNIVEFSSSKIVVNSDKSISMGLKTKTEVFHLPNNAYWYSYNQHLEYSTLGDMKALGTQVNRNILNSSIVYDDDNLCYVKTSASVYCPEMDNTGLTYNTQSQFFYNEQLSHTEINNKDVLGFICYYSSDTFNPKVYDYVLPTPITNTHADRHVYNGGWTPVFGTFSLAKHVVEVYGLTDTVLDGLIKTKSMGSISYPVFKTRSWGRTVKIGHPETNLNLVANMGLITKLSNVLDYPNTKSVYSMTGMKKYSPYINEVDVTETSRFGTVNQSDGAGFSFFKCYSGNKETLVAETRVALETENISDTLWNTFDENGNIRFAMEMYYLNHANQIVIGGTTVHAIGVTGYIEFDGSNLFSRVYGEASTLSGSNVADVFGFILNTYNGIAWDGYDDLVTYRNNWCIGRQITDRRDSIEYINELCSQTWCVGFTNRTGTVVIKPIEYVGAVPEIHDDNIIVRDSVSISLTPLTKIYNELTTRFDYNNITSTFDRSFSVTRISESAFPGPYELEPSGNMSLTTDTTVVEAEFNFHEMYYVQLVSDVLAAEVQVGDKIRCYWTHAEKRRNIGDELIDSVDNLNGAFYTGTVIGLLNPNTILIGDIVDFPLYTQSMGYHVIVTAKNCDYYEINTTVNEEYKWRQFVNGIDSYSDAKDIWDDMKNSFEYTKTINVYPQSFSDLSWIIDYDAFNDNDTKPNYLNGGYNSFDIARKWISRQKYIIQYKLPITEDTIKLELMDRIEFRSSRLTGSSGIVGNICGIQVNPSDKTIDVKLIALMDYTTIPHTGIDDIVEVGVGVDDDIIEAGTNTDDIVEVGV